MLSSFKRVLITGGYGFIGSALVRKLLLETKLKILNIDKIGYASDLNSVNKLLESKKEFFLKRYSFKKIDLLNSKDLTNAIFQFKPNLVFHLAAETHVDQSIINPNKFITSNIVGTSNLLEILNDYFKGLSINAKKNFRFIHVSTDEVFGSLGKNGKFSEISPYKPNSPYAASKASSDHLVKAWSKTYRFPAIITNCSNNFGPWQFPEKLIPLTISKCLKKEAIPVYGNGENIRDWIYVEDHVSALIKCANYGKINSSYCIGGDNQISNINLVKMICTFLDNKKPWKKSYKNLIEFVLDRAGHDYRYAIDSSKIKNELEWQPIYKFEESLSLTIDWYLEKNKS